MGCGYGLVQRPPTDATVQGGTDSRGCSRRTTGRLGDGSMAHHDLHRTKTRLMVVETSPLHSTSTRRGGPPLMISDKSERVARGIATARKSGVVGIVMRI